MAIESLRDITRAAASAFADGGGAGYWVGPTAPDPVTYPFWFNTTAGAFLVDLEGAWVEPGANYVPTGGTAGQVLIKQSVADFDIAWGAPTVAWTDVSGKPATFAPSAHGHAIADVTGLQAALDGKLSSESDPVFLASPAAGITAPLIANWSTAFGWGNHASAGYLLPAAIGVTVQGYNANTVFDAAYVHTDNNFTAALLSKLNGIATGATANSADATLLNRTNHTGTQLAATISDLAAAARAQIEAALIAGANVTITPAGSGATRTFTIAATGSGGGGSGLTASQVRAQTLLGF